MVDQQRRLAAILFSDVCGFSRTMGEDERRALAMVEQATSTITRATAEYGGRVIKRMGDGMLCEFPSAVNAVRAAMAAQQAVAIYNRGAPEADRFQIRIGIHVGDVVVAGDDIFGDGVNVASRIEPLAEPGGICISRDVLDLVKNKVVLETVHLGPRDLKNIARKVDIFKVLIDAVERGSAGRAAVAAGRGISRRRWIRGLTGLGLAVLVGVMGWGTIQGVARHRVRRAYESALALARADWESGRRAEAIQKLDAFSLRHRATPWQIRIDELKTGWKREWAQMDVRDRQERFLRAVDANDRETALALVDPETLRDIDGTAIWLRARIAAGIPPPGDPGQRNRVRIVDVGINAEGDTAYVQLEMAIGERDGAIEQWRPIPPWVWRKVGEEWLLHLEAKRPIAPRGDADRPIPLRPRFSPRPDGGARLRPPK